MLTRVALRSAGLAVVSFAAGVGVLAGVVVAASTAVGITVDRRRRLYDVDWDDFPMPAREQAAA